MAGPAELPCPACGATAAEPLLSLAEAPTTDVGLFMDREAARAVPRAPIDLHGCDACGFAWNAAFDPALVPYDAAYESTQIHSPTFRRNLEALVRRLAGSIPPGEGLIVEAGCGQGELLLELCAAARFAGLGFDPAYRGQKQVGRSRFLAQRFDPSAIDAKVLLLVCKMTLEHLENPHEHMQRFAEALGDDGGRLFIQVPRFDQLLADRAWWDIYYEHCNYFSDASLLAAGHRAGLRAIEAWHDFGGQYQLVLFERAAEGRSAGSGNGMLETARAFAADYERDVAAWRRWLAAEAEAGRPVALWGGGSKAVAFVTHLGEKTPLDCAIDINPAKHGSFLPGSGLPVVSPEGAAARGVRSAVLLNPVYRNEVDRMIAGGALAGSTLLDVGAPP